MASIKKAHGEYKKALSTMQEVGSWFNFEVKSETMFAHNDDRNADFIKWVGTKRYEKGTNREGLYKLRDCETSIELVFNLKDGDLDFTIKSRTVHWDFVRVTIDPKCYGIVRQVENIFRSLEWSGEIAVNRVIIEYEREHDERKAKIESEKV